MPSALSRTDARVLPHGKGPAAHLGRYSRATDPDDKTALPGE